MDTLIAQTYPHTEIIVIDDCSPDNSLEVLRRYESDPRVKLIVREKNGGWIAVSNQGIDLAAGEFVLFANCDDACDPRMVERLVDAMRSNSSAGIVFCRSLFIDELGQVVGDDFSTRERSFRKLCAKDTLISAAQMSRFLLESCAIPNLSAALIRKQCFADVGSFSSAYRVCSDWDLYFRVAARFDVAYVAEPLNLFRQHAYTIRSTTKERVVNEEMFRLLLRQIRLLDLSFTECCRYRLHVMYLWAVHLISPSWSGLRNFPYHLRRVLQLDPLALLFLAPGLALRAGGILIKIFWRFRTP
jgi:glycosyltransferase involved in cell wall biosynthesis